MEWDNLIHRLSEMAGEEPTTRDIDDVIAHADDAVAFVDSVEANATTQETYDEYSVVARLDHTRIVGDIDRLIVTPQYYHIVDYKTNDCSATSTHELAAHYRPQMLAYALALFQHDSSRRVKASLRFTDASATEHFEWSADQMIEIKSELRSMVDLIT
jgi:ATP-dependent helicase/nuclease subunit A